MLIFRFYVPFFWKNIDTETKENIENWKKVLIKHDWNKFIAVSVWEIKNKELSKEDLEYSFDRELTEKDNKTLENIEIHKIEYKEEFKKEVEKSKLKLLPSNCEVSFDEKVVLFNFTAENRIDFRELVKNIAWKLRKKIKLNHVWARDRSSLIWWIWTCWKELCCSKFLKDLPSVTITSVKKQDLIYKSSEVLSGLCWKLKCCLNYEVELYQQLKKWLPKVWSKVSMREWRWIVIWADIFSQKIKVKIDWRISIFENEEFKKLIKK